MRKILFIYTTFYGYYNSIEQALKKLGFEIDGLSYQLPLRPSERIKYRLYRNYFNPRVDRKFHQEIQKRKSNNYDYVILLFGLNDLFPEHIELLRSTFGSAKFIYYTWDSVKNFPRILELSALFDRTLSFDRIDCEKYHFEFLPLFYTQKHAFSETKYDFCSIMSFSLSKQGAYQKVLSCLPEGLKSCQNIVVHDRFTYFYHCVFHSSAFKGIDKSAFKFNRLSREEVNTIFSESKVTIDIPVQGQNGLTMRTFEVLANNRKLITTNQDIVHYPFYNPNNIFVYKEGVTAIPRSFFDTPFIPVDSFDDYSVDSFAKKLIL